MNVCLYEGVDPLELELQLVVSCHVGTTNWTLLVLLTAEPSLQPLLGYMLLWSQNLGGWGRRIIYLSYKVKSCYLALPQRKKFWPGMLAYTLMPILRRQRQVVSWNFGSPDLHSQGYIVVKTFLKRETERQRQRRKRFSKE